MMLKDEDYQNLYQSESSGVYGIFGIKILVAGDKPFNLDTLEIRMAANKAADEVGAEIRAEALKTDPEAQEARIKERAQLIGLFPSPIFVEERVNGYCSQWCCRHLPWFVVTTTVGRFTIGWRKRVINIDWSETAGTKTAKELFPAENAQGVTMGDRYIHARSADQAKEFIQKIMAG